MASIGHIAVGMAAGRAFVGKGASRAQLVKAMLAFSTLSMLPDADVVAFLVGIPYEAPFGHRGASHSIGASVIAAGLAFLFARMVKLPPAKTAIYAGVVVMSHALLDTLTNGGLGCALLWPLSNERYFAPVALIPVSPLGLHFLSLSGVLVMAVEMILFCPFFIYATFPRRRPKAT